MKKIGILLIALLTIGFASALTLNLSGVFNNKEDAVSQLNAIKAEMEIEKGDAIASILYTDDVMCKFTDVDSDSICFAYFNYTLNNITYKGRVKVNETVKEKDVDDLTAEFVLQRVDEMYKDVDISYKLMDLKNKSIELTVKDKTIKVK